MTEDCSSEIVLVRATLRNRLEVCLMFSRDRVSSVFADDGPAGGLEEWRAAARLVSARWALFLEAGAQERAWAFASYVAALDAEEAAAEEMAGLAMRAAA
jgi:hypothetical protein